MTLITPIRYVRDVETTTRFYSALGLEEDAAQTSRTWAQLDADGGCLRIHLAAERRDSSDARAVSFQVSVEPGELDTYHERLRRGGWEPGAVIDETFGRYFLVADPDGYEVQVNETPAELQRSYETGESRQLL